MSDALLRVAVLCGGPSTEHDVSLQSGENVARYLNPQRYAVEKIIIERDGRWLLNNQPISVYDTAQGPSKSPLLAYDLVFIALHGAYGEDGTVQALLDSIGVPYTGSGRLASSLGMDKYLSAELVAKQGIAIPKQRLWQGGDSAAFMKRIVAEIGFPCVVKPNFGGSSVGVVMVEEEAQLQPLLTNQPTEPLLIQQRINGRELTCGAWGNRPESTTALPPIEIITKNEFFDYDAKYQPGQAEEICPAQIDPEIEKVIKQQARQVHVSLGCRGLSRSDFILTESGQLVFLEINTIPGLTSNSLCPKEAKTAGLDFPQFLDRLVELGLEK